jgi:hypothetical protein
LPAISKCIGVCRIAHSWAVGAPGCRGAPDAPFATLGGMLDRSAKRGVKSGQPPLYNRFSEAIIVDAGRVLVQNAAKLSPSLVFPLLVSVCRLLNGVVWLPPIAIIGGKAWIQRH